MSSELSIAIKESRLKKGLTQEQLADFVHVRPKTVIDWEYGRKTPHTKNLKRISLALGVDLTKKGVMKGNIESKDNGHGAIVPQEDWYKQTIDSLIQQNGSNMDQYRVRTDDEITVLKQGKERAEVTADKLLALLEIHINPPKDTK